MSIFPECFSEVVAIPIRSSVVASCNQMAEKFSRFHEARDYQGKGVDVYDDNLIELEQASLAEPITQVMTSPSSVTCFCC